MTKANLINMVMLAYGFFVGVVAERFFIKYEKQIVSYLNNLAEKFKKI